jgi:hypothetical protein
VNPTVPDPESFTWQVLVATASDVGATTTTSQLVIALSVVSNATSSHS